MKYSHFCHNRKSTLPDNFTMVVSMEEILYYCSLKTFQKSWRQKILNDTTFKVRNRDEKSINQQIVTPLPKCNPMQDILRVNIPRKLKSSRFLRSNGKISAQAATAYSGQNHSIHIDRYTSSDAQCIREPVRKTCFLSKCRQMWNSRYMYL